MDAPAATEPGPGPSTLLPETVADAPPIAEEQPEQLRETPVEPKHARVTDAIDQVTEVIEELKHVLNEMEDVLETLELAERQKIDDEREIDALNRALRQLHRPNPGAGQRRH